MGDSTGRPAGIVAWVIDKIDDIFDLESSGKLLVCSAIIGVAAGIIASLFYFVLDEFQKAMLGGVVGYVSPEAGKKIDEAASAGSGAAMHMPDHWWLVLLVPTLGGLACGLIVTTLAPEAEGHGTDGMIRAFHRLKGVIRWQVPWVKAVASTITIGTGGSAGREGPVAQIGAGFGSVIASRLGLSDWDRRHLMLAGAAGGIGAIFQAPLGGALFTVEVLYAGASMEFTAFIPAVIASVVAYSVYCMIHGREYVFLVGAEKSQEMLTFHGIHELPLYLVFAFVLATVGFVYIFIFYGLRDRLFRRLPIPALFRPAVGGFLLGGMAIFFPQIMAGGYGWVQQLIDGQFGIGDSVVSNASGGTLFQIILLMIALALAKIVATSFTISSGGSGGVFAPSLFIGAMVGAAFGWTCREIFGAEMVPHPGAYVLVGMAGFFAGVAKVPLTAMLMVCEMSHSYELLVPLMLVTMVTVATLSQRWTLYEEQVTTVIDSPAHFGDFVINVLAEIHVRDVYKSGKDLYLIPETMPLPEIMKVAAAAESSYFPVVDDQQRLVGIFSLHDLRAYLHGDAAGGLIVASDIATTSVLTVTPDDDLHTALRRFTRKNIDELPVVDKDDPKVVLGMLRRKEVIGAYDNQIAQLRHDD